MTTTRNQQNQKDWRLKGLGWVPDYPDARDYILDKEEIQKKGKLRRDEVTTAIEDLADIVARIIDSIDQNSIKQEGQLNSTLKNLKETLENKVFGEIVFKPVKIHKILRRGTQGNEDIVQLKHFLNLLRQHRNLADFKNKFDKLEQKLEIQKYEWLKNKDFDEFTENVVKVFQEIVSIQVDGVVGLETYSAIQDYLSDENKELEVQEPPLRRIKLISVPSFISYDSFLIIFKKLVFWYEKLVNYNLQVTEDNFEKCVQEIFGGGNSLNDFLEIFKQEFSTVEPLVSAIVQNLYPLSQYESLTQAVEQGSNSFSEAILKERQSEQSETGNSINKKNAQKALQKMKRLIDYEKQEKNNAVHQEKNEIIRKFYDFIDEIVKAYIQKDQDPNKKDIYDSNKPSYWDKTYLIEIEKLDKNTQQHFAFFTPVDLHIPLNRSLDKTLDESKNILSLFESKPYPKLYFFLPSVVDLSYWCSPIRDQGSLHSCAAFAGAALFEYFARKSLSESSNISPLFLYKVARNLMQCTGDTGASIRETMRGMVAFGVPPEKYWSYEEEKFDEEPPAFCYSYAQNYQTLKYFRLDYGAISTDMLLFRVKAVLAAGFPCMFGFTVYRSIYKPDNIKQGYIPYPSKRDEVVGGHVVVAVGYDDYKKIENDDDQKDFPVSGALLIRNSWGTQWGQGGYGWLPYEYVLKGLTADWWSLLKAEWFEAGNFGLGAWDSGDTNGEINKD